MSNIVPFSEAKLPSYLAKVGASNDLADLLVHGSKGFPVISIKGKVFATVRNGERKVIPNPKDPESPATAIEVVMLKVQKGESRVFYAKEYADGDAGEPDCSSSDGVKPDASAPKPQCKSCAACAHNVFGTGKSGKGKRCSTNVRIAVATPDNLDDAYLLRAPVMSLKAVGEYGQMLKSRGINTYKAVVTKIGFEMDQPVPVLNFKPVGFLPEDMFAQAVASSESDTVKQIVGELASATVEAPAHAEEPIPEYKPAGKEEAATAAEEVIEKVASKSKTVSDAEVKAVVEAATKPKAKVKPVEEEAVEVDGIDGLDELGFDD